MLGIVATLKVKPGMEQEFEALARQLVEKVRAGEPGCTLQTLGRKMGDYMDGRAELMRLREVV